MTRTTARLVRVAGGLIAGVVVLTGCSGSGDGSASDNDAAAESSTEASSFNEADVTFAQEMLPHHRGAVEMAQLAEGRSEDPQVLDLASRIEAAQGPEIETLTGWLEDWDQPEAEESDSGMEGMDMGGMSMGGMSEEDMSALEAASGVEFDRMFLTMMIEHHRGAVEMAQTEVSDGKNTGAVEMAGEIVESQNAEIAEMETLLDELDS